MKEFKKQAELAAIVPLRDRQTVGVVIAQPGDRGSTFPCPRLPQSAAAAAAADVVLLQRCRPTL